MLEVAANSVTSALAAAAGGAARVELCTALELGGLTPSHAAIATAQARLDLPVFVLIRPRAGDFVYDDLETEVMRRDIEHCRMLGCAGVVIGALTAQGDIDLPRCRALLDAAGAMSASFHRAFDFARAPFAALDAIIDLGCKRLLTAGQAEHALAGAALIRQLVAHANGRITIMPGGGITPANIAALQAATGAREFHASAKAQVTRPAQPPSARLGAMDAHHAQTDAATVRALVTALHGAN